MGLNELAFAAVVRAILPCEKENALGFIGKGNLIILEAESYPSHCNLIQKYKTIECFLSYSGDK